MQPYTQLCSALLFPLHERFKGHRSVALRRQLENSQWLTTQQLQQSQVRGLRNFLASAQRDVPYYRDLFAQADFNPRAVDTVSDLLRLPRLTKQQIRENTEALKSVTCGPLMRLSTGGSSGEPLTFYVGRNRVTHDVAAKWRATRWWGVDIGDPEIVLWGSPLELGAQDRVRAWRDRLFRSRLLPAFQMSESKIDEYIRVIAGMRPRMIFGYASAIAILARRAQATGSKLADLGIKVITTTGETLYADQRKLIEATFGAPVANSYGSRDAGFIAHQCPQGALHISAEDIIVEILDDAGHPVSPGTQGEIVTTHLATGDFPFIRYRTGDMAILSEIPCACGRGLPILSEVLGRTTDLVRTRSGNVMHALALIYEVRDRPGVTAFKFIQAADYSLELQLVVSASFSETVEQQIRDNLIARMGPGTALTIRQVGEIAPERSGKYRYVVSYATS